eukprot:scaffold909_cov575-Prasinococcus_capsulatus_cf.AAC.18
MCVRACALRRNRGGGMLAVWRGTGPHPTHPRPRPQPRRELPPAGRGSTHVAACAAQKATEGMDGTNDEWMDGWMDEQASPAPCQACLQGPGRRRCLQARLPSPT